jgi:PBSX family phage terminase large subunit
MSDLKAYPIITHLRLEGKNGTEKIISFEKDGIWNIPQLDYFNALFKPDLSLKTDYEEAAYFGAFRCAKSFTQQLAVYIISNKYKQVRSVYVRDTYDELETSVIEQFRQDFEYLGTFDYLKSDRVATFKDTGSKIYFRAFNYDTDILSSERDLIAACQTEDIPEELFLQFFGRLSGKALPRPLLLTEGNPASNYVKKRYKDQSDQQLRAKKIFFVQGKTEDNPHISKGYIDRVRANYPAFWVARYLDGEWSNLDEMVFSEFRESRDVVEPIDINTSFKKRAGLDYGWVNPSGIVWSNVDYDGKVVIFDCWKAAQKTPAEIAQEAKRHGKMPIIADYSIKKADRDGRSLWQDLLVEGLNLVESNKQELENIVLVNSLFKQGRLKITRNCYDLIYEIINYKWKKMKLGEEKNHPEQTVDKDNHLIDAMLYMIADIEELKTQRPEVELFKKSILYKTAEQQKATDIQNLS